MSRNIRGPVAAAGMMVGLAFAVVAGVVAFHAYSHRAREMTLNQTQAEEQTPPGKKRPDTFPSTKSSPPSPTEQKPDANYMDVVRTTYPAFPTTQPLAFPLDLSQAARIVLNDPVYLSRVRGDLWITRGDAPPVQRVLHEAIDPNAADPQSHIVDRRVEFVHWMPADSGAWLPYLVCPTADHDHEVIWEHGQANLPTQRDFQWNRAFSIDEDVVVPSGSGISVLHFGQPIKESYFQLVANAPGATTAPSPVGQVQVLRDSKGLLAWMPWEHGAGSRGAVRYVKGAWTPLGPDQGWPERISYLVPLLDGTVFQFVSDESGSISIQSTALDTPDVDEPAIRKLVTDLSDVDQDVRKSAFTQLANFGPRIWPLLEKLRETATPQAKLMIGQLLKDKNRPTLSGMTLLGRRELTLVSRLSDGGVVLYAEQGISIPESEDQSTAIAPAWLSIRPGHYIELLSPALVNDLKPQEARFEVVGDQWTVNNDVRGPRLFYGNGLATLLRKEDQAFTQVIGMDQMGRWLFRKGDELTGSGPTLIIDPHLPDPTPRLPVWQLAIAETVGWDKQNWPAVKNGAIYSLTATDWRLVENEESFASQPAPSPTTAPASEPTDIALCKTHDGAVFYDGLTELRMVEPDGKRTTWPLPPTANGEGPATLIEATDGRLFLFNQRGRVLRIARTPHQAEPFKLEATFTHNIPSVAKPTRIWLDPAGRIDIAWGDRLAILFPAGYIPGPIMQKIADRSGLDADGP